VDDSLSLSNEMRCRGRVEYSAALSERLWDIGGARRGKVDVCVTRASCVMVVEEGRGSNEAPSGLPLLLLLRRVPVPTARPVGEEWR
jgi:hypothetical protein